MMQVHLPGSLGGGMSVCVFCVDGGSLGLQRHLSTSSSNHSLVTGCMMELHTPVVNKMIACNQPREYTDKGASKQRICYICLAYTLWAQYGTGTVNSRIQGATW